MREFVPDMLMRDVIARHMTVRGLSVRDVIVKDVAVRDIWVRSELITAWPWYKHHYQSTVLLIVTILPNFSQKFLIF